MKIFGKFKFNVLWSYNLSKNNPLNYYSSLISFHSIHPIHFVWVLRCFLPPNFIPINQKIVRVERKIDCRLIPIFFALLCPLFSSIIFVWSRTNRGIGWVFGRVKRTKCVGVWLGLNLLIVWRPTFSNWIYCLVAEKKLLLPKIILFLGVSVPFPSLSL